MNKTWEVRVRVFLVLLVLCIFAAVKVVDVYVSQEAANQVEELEDISKRSLGKLTVDAMKANIQDHVVEPIIHRIKREVRDYTTTSCETSLGGVCRRNDLACGGTFQGGADCDLGLSDSSYTGSAYHECCNVYSVVTDIYGFPKALNIMIIEYYHAEPFVPVDGLGNPVTGTDKEIADAIRSVWTDTGLEANENCDDGTLSSCSFWTGGMKAIAVNGINDKISDSGCNAAKITVIQASEISHSHSDFGTGITAQNGFVVRIQGVGRCFGNYVEANNSPYDSLTNAYIEVDGSVIYQMIDTNMKIYDIAFIPSL